MLRFVATLALLAFATSATAEEFTTLDKIDPADLVAESTPGVTLDEFTYGAGISEYKAAIFYCPLWAIEETQESQIIFMDDGQRVFHWSRAWSPGGNDLTAYESLDDYLLLVKTDVESGRCTLQIFAPNSRP